MAYEGRSHNAASLEQARLTYGFIREWLDDGSDR